MPCFNAAVWLSDCLLSIIRQEEQDWELIAVDDYSEDESKAILDQYAQKDQRIKVYSNQEAKGVIPCLRRAFEESSGTFISRMDADDLMPPGKLSRMAQVLEARGPGHLITGLVIYFASDRVVKDGYRRYALWLNSLTLSHSNFRDRYRECVIPSPCWMSYRTDLEACGAFQPDRYPEDIDLAFRMYEQGLEVVGIPEVLHLWRDHGKRSTRTLQQYLDRHYFKLKIHWFIRLDYAPTRPLVLWGAGQKGKALAQLIKERGLPFRWVCQTPSKWGLHIYDQLIESTDIFQDLDNPQVILAVAAPEGVKTIKAFFENYPADTFWFC